MDGLLWYLVAMSSIECSHSGEGLSAGPYMEMKLKSGKDLPAALCGCHVSWKSMALLVLRLVDQKTAVPPLVVRFLVSLPGGVLQ